jgi:D-alanine-D-alanine ligase
MLGGNSAEREISLKSGQAVLAALRHAGVDAWPFDPAERSLAALKAENYDRVFIALHGRGGEDGSLQGALDLMRLPYSGSGVLASALAMDKWRSKLLWQTVGIPVPDYLLLNEKSDWQAVTERLGLPLFVKPANEGSSIGISKVKRVADLAEAYRLAAQYDSLVLAERCIDGDEVQFPILGDQVLPSIRIETPHEFYDYDAKYCASDTRYICPGLTPEEEKRLTGPVLDSFRVLGCRGWGRVDLMLERKTRQPYFLEMNTSPGMTDHSLVPMAAKAAGISFAALTLRVLEMARHD